MTNHWSTHAPTSGTTSGMAVAGCWDALLVGTVRRSVASNLTYNVAESTDINITSASRSKASVCLLRFDPHSNAHAGGAHTHTCHHLTVFLLVNIQYYDLY